ISAIADSPGRFPIKRSLARMKGVSQDGAVLGIRREKQDRGYEKGTRITLYEGAGRKYCVEHLPENAVCRMRNLGVDPGEAGSFMCPAGNDHAADRPAHLRPDPFVEGVV